MGRAKTDTQIDLSKARQVACEVLRAWPVLHKVDAYLFGSALRGLGVDIDILIVARSNAELLEVKRELANAKRFLPLDVLVMDPTEEIETDFIKREGCVALSRLIGE